jgi:hypothetical protein
VSLETGDILGIVDAETDTPIPLDDDSLAIILSKSTNCYRKSKRERGPEKKLKTDVISEQQNNTGASTLTPSSSIKHP